jgi:PadR family transcriptional regulator PadR
MLEDTSVPGDRRQGIRSAADRASSMPGGRTSLVEPTLLCALATQPGHGYDLKRTVEEITEGLVALDLPGTYRMLRRLETEGIVESSWAAGAAGPQRREYTLTPAGWTLLEDWRQFLSRQRRACQLTTGAIDAALGSKEASSACADDSSIEASAPGGDA